VLQKDKTKTLLKRRWALEAGLSKSSVTRREPVLPNRNLKMVVDHPPRAEDLLPEGMKANGNLPTS